MRDQLLVADTREKALEEHHKVLAGARGTSTVIAYMDLGSLDSHNVYAAELYTVEMTLTPEGNAESLSSLITKRRFGPAQSQRAHLVWLEWLPGMTGSVATNGPTSMLKELLIAWGPSGPALVLYAMVRRRLQALIRECWRQLWANNDHGPSLQRVLTAPNRVMQTEDYSNWLSWLLWSATNYRSLDRQELIACPTYLHGAPAPHGLTALTED
ncbi:hypothetical protein KXV68_003474 [Aspergillus fumigatus]|nr:hypothetical protein KXX67_003294 [Aspergillus fumigatus]KAH1419260.1 hypothetical protein KXX64_001710 [Aspergillus fumigatus]KAH1690034.1 hypothetical protein KXX23_003132 [Aspergillus fumigatus]KAH1721886.1 hypothetical protein KXX25_001911 [Aspergillus fumigatus]KAH1734915.1 hypothetical protein KXX40_007400 [Aspergillus fumigatus]